MQIAEMIRFMISLFATALATAAAVAAGPWTPSEMAVPEPAREFRAVWATTVYNLDWPSRPGLPMETQQTELRAMLDSAAALRLNAVLLQVRPGGDAVYDSKLEPWSAVLTGTMGQSPGYDPLALAVSEAHLRGLELHAWFNPFRAKVGKAEAAPTHWTMTHPEWVRAAKGHDFMDPGVPEVRAHVLSVMRDVLTRYDIDGIHIDDYFYPYPVFGPGAVRLEVPLGDEERFAREGNGLSLADWRREQINTFVKDMYALTREVKPAARVGISPFGIWQPGVPEGIQARVSAYDHLYGDSRKWLQEGWCDYLTPQLYWPIQPPAQSFTTLMAWWQAQSTGRPIWPGMAVDRVASTKEPLLPVRELQDQLAVLRLVAGAQPGMVLWRMKFLMSDGRGVATLLREEGFPTRSLPPAASWLGSTAPEKPILRADGAKISWTAASGQPARWWLIQTLEAGDQWTLLPTIFGDISSLTLEDVLAGKVEAIALRAISASGVSGPPTVLSRTQE